MPRYDPSTGQLETYQVGPFDQQHLYVQWGGKLPGNESWSCGVRLAFTGAGAKPSTASLMPGYKAAIQTFHTAANTYISAEAKLSFIKVNEIKTDGHYASDVTTQDVYADVAGGSAGQQLHPNQVALAVTLVTGFSMGLARKGRFYLPLINLAPALDGLITTAGRDFVKGTANTWFTAMNAVHADYDLAIFSRKQGAPTHRLATGIQVGRALDTQRRRRRKMTELWA